MEEVQVGTYKTQTLWDVRRELEIAQEGLLEERGRCTKLEATLEDTRAQLTAALSACVSHQERGRYLSEELESVHKLMDMLTNARRKPIPQEEDGWVSPYKAQERLFAWLLCTFTPLAQATELTKGDSE